MKKKSKLLRNLPEYMPDFIFSCAPMDTVSEKSFNTKFFLVVINMSSNKEKLYCAKYKTFQYN